MVTAWERSHLHFLSDWLPGGGKPELDASAKWSLHRTPLSRTIPSFNLPLCKQNNENCPFQVLALWPAPVFPHRELRLVSLLSVRPCNSSLLSESTGHMGSTTQGLCTPGLGYVMLLDVGYSQLSATGVRIVSIVN